MSECGHVYDHSPNGRITKNANDIQKLFDYREKDLDENAKSHQEIRKGYTDKIRQLDEKVDAMKNARIAQLIAQVSTLVGVVVLLGMSLIKG